MQSVSSGYTTKSQSTIRKVVPKVEVDWDNDTRFSDETNYLKYFEVERVIDEPQSAVFSAQGNISLVDTHNRYTPIGSLPVLAYDGVDNSHLKFNTQRKLLITSIGNFVLFFTHDGKIYYIVSQNKGINWSSAVEVATGLYPSVDIDSSDNIYLSYETSGELVKFRKLTYTSNTWTIGTEYQVNDTDDGDYGTICKIQSDGRIWVVYSDYDATDCMRAKYSDNDGVTWSSEYSIGTSDFNPKQKYTAIMRNDVLFVFWYSNSNIYWSSYDSGGDAFVAEASIRAINPTSSLVVTKTSNDNLYLSYIYNSTCSIHEFNGSTWAGNSDLFKVSYSNDNFNISTDGTDLFFIYGDDTDNVTYNLFYDISESLISERFILYGDDAYNIATCEVGTSTIIPIVLSVEDATTYYLYFTGLSTDAKYNLRANIPVKLSVGFGSETPLQLIAGKSEIPNNQQLMREHNIHFFDEIKSLNDFNLPYKTAFTTKRTDDYITEILREYWGSLNYKVLHNCNTYNGNGTWINDTNASNIATTTAEWMLGGGAVSFDGADASNPYQIAIKNTSLTAVDINKYLNIGKIRAWIYLPNATNLTSITLRWGSGASDYWSLAITTDYFGNAFSAGWNLIEFNWANATETGTCDCSAIDYLYLLLTGDDELSMTGIVIDDFTIYMPSIPAYYHDKGLQNITIASFDNNKALYEIKTACESEGGRFYVHEQGYYVFENRQHYNTAVHQTSEMEFNFNSLIDLGIGSKTKNIINKIILTFNKRVEQDTKDIWNWGEVPKLLTAGQTIEVWANYNDPVVTYTAPTATTDYTANTQADGAGTDKTAQISISETNYSTSTKLSITNNDAGSVYLTLMKLRGKPYEEQGNEKIIIEDISSQKKYGIETLEISNKYLNDSDNANAIGNYILDIYKEPLNIINLRNRSIPQLQIGDIITIRNNETNMYYVQRIISIFQTIVDGGLNTEIVSRKIVDSEFGVYFTINVSSIGGTDPLSP